VIEQNRKNRENYRKKHPVVKRLDKPKIPKPKKVKILKQVKVIEPLQPCPTCNSIDFVKRNGHKRGKQLFRCTSCKKSFIYPYEDPSRKRIYGKKVGHITELPFFDTANLLKQFNKPKLNVDSLEGICCFGCLESTRGCNPNSCVKMDNWLKEVNEKC
jgi:transposase-like protein